MLQESNLPVKPGGEIFSLEAVQSQAACFCSIAGYLADGGDPWATPEVEQFMPSQVVNIQVTASIPIACDFWSEGDGWKGLCKSPSVTVRGSSFEDAKKNMAAELPDAHRKNPT